MMLRERRVGWEKPMRACGREKREREKGERKGIEKRDREEGERRGREEKEREEGERRGREKR